MDAPRNDPAQPLSGGFRIGDLRVDPRTGDLTGPAGREQLDPKVMGVLLMLAERPREVVSRDALLGRVWPGTVVSEDALTRCLYELRRQMAAAGGDESLRAVVETLPKRGYRLKGDVVPIDVPAARRNTGRRWAAVAAAAVALIAATVLVQSRFAAPARAAVAVIPFEDMSAHHDQGYLADGVAEEILNALSQSEELRVIGRTSSFSVRGQNLDIREIAQRMNATHVLEGSVRKSGDRLRVTAQLLSGKDGLHLWSNTFERGVDDVFAIQDDIAAAVAAALEVRLGRERPAGGKPTSYAAWERYRQAEFFYGRRAPGDFERARKYYEEAVSLDPRYALAWAALSGAYGQLAWDTDPPSQELQDRQRAAAEKAVALAPGLAVAHARLGIYYAEFTEDEAQARAHYLQAAALDPDEPLVLNYRICDAIIRGDFRKAIAVQRRIVAHDPQVPQWRSNLAAMLLADGRLAEALSEYRQVLEINPDADPEVHADIVRILVLQGRFDEAAKAAESFPAGTYRDYALALLDKVPARAGAAEAALKRMIEQDLDAPRGPMMDSIRLADALSWRGQYDDAFAVLRRKLAATRGRQPERALIFYLQDRARFSPLLEPMHDDPRWAAFLAAR